MVRYAMRIISSLPSSMEFWGISSHRNQVGNSLLNLLLSLYIYIYIYICFLHETRLKSSLSLSLSSAMRIILSLPSLMEFWGISSHRNQVEILSLLSIHLHQSISLSLSLSPSFFLSPSVCLSVCLSFI